MDVKIAKGADIKLKGTADRVYSNIGKSKYYAVKPVDFHLLVPKLIVKVGDHVKAGDVIFHDKNMEVVKFTSPVSGVVSDIVRGAKRKILEVRIESDLEIQYKEFQKKKMEGNHS